MRSQRVGRFRGDPEKKAKPMPELPPLHERIDPTAKGLNLLDDQEKELEQAYAKGMDSELYFRLLSIIETKREKLVASSDRLAGIPVVKPDKDTPVIIKAARKPSRGSQHVNRHPPTAKSLGRLLFFGVVIIFCIKMFFNA